jgi:uncharacterized protein (TIGR00369 family)
MTEGEARPDGLAVLEAIRAGRLPRPPVADTFDFAIVALDRGRIAIETVPPAAMRNPAGAITGGYAATLLDSACGLALQAALPAGRAYTTLELKVAFHRGLTVDSGPLRTSGEVVTIGRRVGFTRAELTDARGRLCASATSTLLIFDQPADGA